MPFDVASLLGFDFSKIPKVDRNTAGGMKTAFTGLVVVQIDGDDTEVAIDFALGWSVPVIGYNILSSCKLEVNYIQEVFSLSKL